jgi:hypothetical protein
VKEVRDPVYQDRVQGGITKPDFDHVPGGRIVLPDGCYVVEEERSHVDYLKRSVLK